MPLGRDELLLLIRDVTERVRLNKMRRDFVANASHELRSPLTVISGYLDALATDETGTPLTLISDLSDHTRALKADPRCSILVGEPGPRGDPLTHPRMTLLCTARFTDRATVRLM